MAFKVEDEIFYAHQYVLKIRAADFANDFCDSQDKVNPASIDDVHYRIFRLMLNHAYGEDISTDDWDWYTKNILDASAKYGFNALRSEAESSYLRNLKLTVNNATDELLYTDGNDLQALKSQASSRFIVIFIVGIEETNSIHLKMDLSHCESRLTPRELQSCITLLRSIL